MPKGKKGSGPSVSGREEVGYGVTFKANVPMKEWPAFVAKWPKEFPINVQLLYGSSGYTEPPKKPAAPSASRPRIGRPIGSGAGGITARGLVSDCLRSEPDKWFTIKEVADFIEKGGRSRTAAGDQLRKLTRDGVALYNNVSGLYRYHPIQVVGEAAAKQGE